MLGSSQAHADQEQRGPTDLAIRCPTAGQRYAADALREAIGQKRPLIVVFGDSGCGKTALIDGVLGSTDPRQFAVLNFSATGGEFSSAPSFDSILEAMCRRLGTVKATQRRPETLAGLSAAVNDLAKKGQTLLLAIDHADHLNVDVIAELAKLTEYLDIAQDRIVRIFVGSMTLASRIDWTLRQLGVDQRLAEIRLSQPSADEVATLLAYEDSAQMGGPMLTPGAIDRISAYAKSNLHWAVPMADAARAFAEGDGKREVTAEMVKSVLLEIWSPDQAFSNEVETPVGLSDSLSRSPDLDAVKHVDTQDGFLSEDFVASETVNESPSAPRRRSTERFVPIAAVSLFIIGTIVLAALDNRVDVALLQPESIVEEVRQNTPADTSGAVSATDGSSSESAQQPPQEAGADTSPQGPNDLDNDVAETGAATQDIPADMPGADSKPLEMYGPWPESAMGGHSNEPLVPVPQEAGMDPSKTGSGGDQPKKVKSPPKRKNAVLKPLEARPEDLTSKHWIQKR